MLNHSGERVAPWAFGVLPDCPAPVHPSAAHAQRLSGVAGLFKEINERELDWRSAKARESIEGCKLRVLAGTKEQRGYRSASSSSRALASLSAEVSKPSVNQL
jgi:hypothetical protein